MSRFTVRSMALAASAMFAAGSLSSANAATTVITGVFNTDDQSFSTFINLPKTYTKVDTSSYFTLDFGDAPIYGLDLSETGDAIFSLFYVQDQGEFFVDAGVSPVDLDCAIFPGESCTQGVGIDGAFVNLSVSESNGLISGSQTLGGFYDDCFAPGEVPVDGAICGVANDAVFAAALRVDFPEPGQLYPYTLTISDAPIRDGVPEPATWAMLLLGFGAIGAAMRRQRVLVSYSGA